ncbi:MAG: hypothetical protein ACTS6P_01500 [Candidatus Hodgkinia cicadicola]
MDSAVGRPQGFKVNQMAVLANGGVLVQSWEPKRRRTFVMFEALRGNVHRPNRWQRKALPLSNAEVINRENFKRWTVDEV